MIILEKEITESSICTECDWNDLTHDEYGVIDYCIRCDIYTDNMEGMKQCLYFDNRLKNE